MSDNADNYETVVRDQHHDEVADFNDHHSLMRRFQSLLHATPSLVPLVVLLASTLSFGIYLQMQGRPFLAPSTLSLIMQQVQIVGIVAAGQSLIVLTAGIDLSVGAIMVLSSVVMGKLAVNHGMPAPLAILAGFLVGAGVGYVNGWLVARVRLPPFIVTLGTWQIFLAANFLYSRNETIRSQEVREVAPMLQWLGLKPNEQFVSWYERWQGIVHEGRRPADTGNATLDLIWSVNITYGVVALVILVFVLAWVLRNTAWGRHVYAVGDDPEAAQLSGVNVKATLISVYVLAGLICSLAGWALIGRIGSISPTSGYDANIQSITAVVIGGISLFGGRGSIMGVFFGGLIVGVYELGLRMAGADAQWTYLLIGALIIGAVAVDQWIRKAAA